MEVLLPGIQSARTVGQLLAVRALYHVGEKHFDLAWRDLLAIHRTGRLVAQGQCLVEQLVGIAIDQNAHEGTLALLDQPLSVDQARQIQRDLASLPYFNNMGDSMDSMERLSYLDAVVQLAARHNDRILQDIGENGRQQWIYIRRVRVNWNVVLEKGNQYFDRLAAAVHLPGRQARKGALSQFEADVNRLASSTHDPGTIAAAVINPSARNEVAAAIMIGMFLPALNSAMESQDRANTALELERLAARLAVYRAEHGSYPDKLEKLVPGVLDKLPVDLYNAAPYVYKRTTDGYLLYSTGDNGCDDGGSNEMMRTFEGRAPEDVDKDDEDVFLGKIPSGADD